MLRSAAHKIAQIDDVAKDVSKENISWKTLTKDSKKSDQKKLSKETRVLNEKLTKKVYYSYDWKHAKKIVAGTYGIIYRVERTNIATNKKWIVAVKALKVKKLAEDQKPDTREIVALEFIKKNRHDSIIEFYGSFQSNNKHLFKGTTHNCFVFQFLDGDLDDLINAMTPESRLPEQTIIYIAKQALEGLAFLHKHCFVHRDIKPDNLMIDEDHNIRITDFGLTAEMPPDASCIDMDGYSGTVEYLSPEEWDCKLAYVSDVWAVGVVLYKLCTCGDLPWEAPEESQSQSGSGSSSCSSTGECTCSCSATSSESHSGLSSDEVGELIKHTELGWEDPAWNEYYPEVKELIAKLLIKDYAERPTADAALLYPLFVSY